jgi:hypothetical protein
MLLGTPLVSPAADGTAREAFRSGVEAAADDDYDKAIAYFEAARRGGLDTGALNYNLGVAYYRTEQPEAAEAAFERAAESENIAGPALYQLGRIAREQDDSARARSLFQRARDAAQTDKLRRLAGAALARLTQREPVTGEPPPDYVYLAGGGGYDSNVSLTPDDDSAASDKSDAFGEAIVSARVPIQGRYYARGDLYSQNFVDETDFNVLSLRGGVGRVGRLGDWRWDSFVDVSHLRFGGDTFENSLIIGGDIERKITEGWELELGSEVAATRGGDDFDFRDGFTAAFELTLDQRGRSGWRLTASAERTDLDDLSRGDDFFSFSNNEIGLEARYAFRLADDTLLDIEGDWRHRSYDDDERRNGTSIGGRDDDRYGAGISLQHTLTANWGIQAAGRVEERDSDIDSFDYTRELLQLRVDYLF